MDSVGRSFLIALALLMGNASGALAEDQPSGADQNQSGAADCSEGPDSQMVGCAAELSKANDAELNVVYGSVSKQLSPDQRKALVKLERKWIKDRDAECVEGLGPSKDDPYANEGSSHMLTSYQQNMCLATRTRERIEWLKEYPSLVKNAHGKGTSGSP